jgi:carboxylesterase
VERSSDPIGPRDLATLPAALPAEYRPEGADRAVLVLHGYTGSPLDMRYLAERLAGAGFAVFLPRLPGAGTEMDDLSRTNRRDWRRRTYDAWLDLRAEFDDISVVGYSMGGLLALDLAAEMRPGALALLAPAVETVAGIIPYTPLLVPFARIIPQVGTEWDPEAAENDDVRAHGLRYWVRRDLLSLAQFARLQAEVRRKLPRVEAPVYVVSSDDDGTADSERSLKTLEERLPRGIAGTLPLSGCRHDVPQGAFREQVADRVIAWLE